MTEITLRVRRRGAPASELEVALADEFVSVLRADIEALPPNAFGEVVGALMAEYAFQMFPGLSRTEVLEQLLTRMITAGDRNFLAYAARLAHAVPADMRADFEAAVRFARDGS